MRDYVINFLAYSLNFQKYFDNLASDQQEVHKLIGIAQEQLITINNNTSSKEEA